MPTFIMQERGGRRLIGGTTMSRRKFADYMGDAVLILLGCVMALPFFLVIAAPFVGGS